VVRMCQEVSGAAINIQDLPGVTWSWICQDGPGVVRSWMCLGQKQSGGMLCNREPRLAEWAVATCKQADINANNRIYGLFFDKKDVHHVVSRVRRDQSIKAWGFVRLLWSGVRVGTLWVHIEPCSERFDAAFGPSLGPRALSNVLYSVVHAMALGPIWWPTPISAYRTGRLRVGRTCVLEHSVLSFEIGIEHLSFRNMFGGQHINVLNTIRAIILNPGFVLEGRLQVRRLRPAGCARGVGPPSGGSWSIHAERHRTLRAPICGS
jgi:hypothetical protein